MTNHDIKQVERAARRAILAAKHFASLEDIGRLNALEYIISEVRHYANMAEELRTEYEGNVIGQDEFRRRRLEVEARILSVVTPTRL